MHNFQDSEKCKSRPQGDSFYPFNWQKIILQYQKLKSIQMKGVSYTLIIRPEIGATTLKHNLALLCKVEYTFYNSAIAILGKNASKVLHKTLICVQKHI